MFKYHKSILVSVEVNGKLDASSNLRILFILLHNYLLNTFR